jgi:hypothetical protein
MKTPLILAIGIASALALPAQAGGGFLQTPVSALQYSGTTSPAVNLKTALNQRQTKTGVIVLLWRSDCAPCLVELGRIAALQEAAGSTTITTLALEPATQARASAARFSIPVRNGFVTTFSTGQVLRSIGSKMILMPTSVMISSNGRICDTHIGILGTDKIRDWAARC